MRRDDAPTRLRRAAAVAALTLVLSSLAAPAGRPRAASAPASTHLPADVPLPNIPIWRDDLMDLRLVDVGVSTAAIDLMPPGRAELPLAPAALAWRPDGGALLIGTTDGASLWRVDGADGTLVRDPRVRIDPFGGPAGEAAIVGVTWLGTPGNAFALAGAREVRVYRLSPSGEAVAVDAWRSSEALVGLAADGANVWLAHATGLRYLASTPTGLVEVPEFAVAGLGRVRAVASHAATGLLAVLAGHELRLFRRATGRFLEIASARLALRDDARAAAFWADGSGLWVLGPGRVEAVALTPRGAEVVPSWTHPAPGHAVAIAAAEAGRAYSLIALPTVETLGWDPVAETAVPLTDRSLDGVGGGRYRPRAELRSLVWEVAEPVRWLRLEAGVSVPPATAVEFEGTTDGGATWTPLPRDRVVPVPAGSRVGYRAVLASTGADTTPEIDWVELSEVRPLTYLTRAGRVRLVR